MKKRYCLLYGLATLISLAVLHANLLPQAVAQTNQGSTAEKESAYMYRYKSASGHITMGFQVPLESLKLGYEVLNKRLQVIRTVPPAMSEKEKTAIEKDRKRHQKEARLLKSFSSAADAERARDRKLSALDVIIKITRGNITQLNLDYENLASSAASHQRTGGKVPTQLKDNMQSIEKQIADAKFFIEGKLKERRSTEEKYNADIESLKKIEARNGVRSSD